MAEPIAVDQAFIRKLTDKILANLENENFGVMELAHESGMSIYSLNRRLHSINQKTGTQFIREIRLQRALELLQSGEVTASQVAYKVGFNSPAYFSTCFHEYFGYPPGKVKKESLNGHKESSHSPVTSEKLPERTKYKTFVIAVSGILLLAVLVYMIYSVSAKHNAGESINPEIYPEKSIAVLPFKNLSNNQSDQYFIDGVMDEIFIKLSKIHDLRVVSRTSVEQYRNTDRSIPEIARELNVNYIVEGRGQKYDNTFRLRVQLIEGSADRQIWAGSYEREIYETRDIFTIQSQVAQTIASELNATITKEEQELIDRIPTANLTAYDLYTKASGYQKEYQKSRNLNIYGKAVTFYKAALELDSSFARAYSDLSSLYLARYYGETYFKEDFLDSCLVLANIALSFDGQMDEAYFIIGRCNFEKGNIEKALVNYDKSLEINPDYSDAHAYKGYLLTSLVNDYVGGIDSYQKAVSTAPPEYKPDLLRGLGQAYLDVGFIDETRNCYKEAFDIDGNKGLYLFNLSNIEVCLENFEEAIRLANEAGKVDSAYFPETSYFYGSAEHNTEAYLQANKLLRRFRRSGELNLNQAHRVGYAFWKMGRYNEATNFFNQQIRYSRESIKLKRHMAEYKGAHYDLAAIYAFMSEKEKAYQYLDEFNKKKFYSLGWISLAKHDPFFKSIRNEERFQAILQNMESKYQAEHERVRKWMEEQKRE